MRFKEGRGKSISVPNQGVRKLPSRNNQENSQLINRDLPSIFVFNEQRKGLRIKNQRIKVSDWLISHLDKEEAGRRGRVVVDVNRDQHSGGDDERHQEDAKDQTDVQRVCARHGAVRRHHWKTRTRTRRHQLLSQTQHI